MAWLNNTEGQALDTLAGVLATRPELKDHYERFSATLGSEVPPRLLELCRLRIAAIHDCAAEWRQRQPGITLSGQELGALKRGDFQSFSAEEQAALQVAERVPYAHHALTDEEVAEVGAALGESATVSLLTALAFFDATCRLKLVFEEGED